LEAGYQIILARPQDLSRLSAIELAAAALLSGHAPAAVLTETTSELELKQAQLEARLWVALHNDQPVGFAQAEILGHQAHLKEIDVHPTHGQRGIGTRLVLSVCEWAAHSGYAEITLTTFRDVRWNMPFYARLGFTVIRENELSESLLHIMANEAQRGLDPSRRVAMRRLL